MRTATYSQILKFYVNRGGSFSGSCGGTLPSFACNVGFKNCIKFSKKEISARNMVFVENL